MNKNRVKFWIFAFALLLAIPSLILGFAALSSFIAAFNTGANPASIFRGHTLFIPEPEQARWMSSESSDGAQPTEIELEELISAYWSAWDALAQARRTGDLDDLPTYWGGAALENVRAAAQERSTLMHEGHQLSLTFFSEDSSVARIHDESFSYTLTIADATFPLTATLDAVMTLDNGFWRIRQYRIEFS